MSAYGSLAGPARAVVYTLLSVPLTVTQSDLQEGEIQLSGRCARGSSREHGGEASWKDV